MATFKIVGSTPVDGDPTAMDVTIRLGNLKGKTPAKALLGLQTVEQVLADDKVTFEEYFFLGAAIASIVRA